MSFNNITITHSVKEMISEKFFKDMFESIPDYRKKVLFIFVYKDDKNLLKECGFLKSDINRLNLEFKTILKEQNVKYLEYIKNEEDSKIERIPNR